MKYSNEYLLGIVNELCKLPTEQEWVEFKLNNANPEQIGEYISALSNSATLADKTNAYLLWGIDDTSHEIIGTTFKPHMTKIGQEELENWLLRLLNPRLHISFYQIEINDKCVVLCEISRANRQPISFKNQEFIRVGSYNKKLKEYPEKERELWKIFDQIPFEREVALKNLTTDEVFQKLDYQAYFDLLKSPLPNGYNSIIEALKDDELITNCETGNWDITKLGAILFAKDINCFHSIKRKALRVIHYKGSGRTETIREQLFNKGYACSFGNIIEYIMATTPSREIIKNGIRSTMPMFPEIAVRELVANALIHQDFFMTGTGPMVEIFYDRIEITNPGKPLVDTLRFLDTPPKSRNETLASLMRRFGICEERGSGIDKVVFLVELLQLPAPEFEQSGDFTKAKLFSHKALSQMDKSDRVRACYLHACLQRVTNGFLTNTSLRKRLGIDEKNKSVVSRYIREAVLEGMICLFDKDAPDKLKKYLPYWA